MSKKNVTLTPDQLLGRLAESTTEEVFKFSYKNPWLLATLYYTEGLSTIEIADALGCEQRTVRRYMNYYGFKRFTKKFSLLVKHHGIEGALKIQPAEYYPLGVHND
jgi:hypothetical protein